MLATVAGSEAIHTRPVARLYRAVLHRAPGAPYLRARVADHRRGVYISSMANELLGSREFRAAHGTPSNQALVDLIYRNVLGRPPSTSSLATVGVPPVERRGEPWGVRAGDQRVRRVHPDQRGLGTGPGRLPRHGRVQPVAARSSTGGPSASPPGPGLMPLIDRLYTSSTYAARFA